MYLPSYYREDLPSGRLAVLLEPTEEWNKAKSLETCFIHPRLSSFSPLFHPHVCVSCGLTAPASVHLSLLRPWINIQQHRIKSDAIKVGVTIHLNAGFILFKTSNRSFFTTAVRTKRELFYYFVGKSQTPKHLRYGNSWISAPSAGQFPFHEGPNKKAHSIIQSLVINCYPECFHWT